MIPLQSLVSQVPYVLSNETVQMRISVVAYQIHCIKQVLQSVEEELLSQKFLNSNLYRQFRKRKDIFSL